MFSHLPSMCNENWNRIAGGSSDIFWFLHCLLFVEGLKRSVAFTMSVSVRNFDRWVATDQGSECKQFSLWNLAVDSVGSFCVISGLSQFDLFHALLVLACIQIQYIQVLLELPLRELKTQIWDQDAPWLLGAVRRVVPVYNGPMVLWTSVGRWVSQCSLWTPVASKLQSQRSTKAGCFKWVVGFFSWGPWWQKEMGGCLDHELPVLQSTSELTFSQAEWITLPSAINPHQLWYVQTAHRLDIFRSHTWDKHGLSSSGREDWILA